MRTSAADGAVATTELPTGAVGAGNPGFRTVFGTSKFPNLPIAHQLWDDGSAIF